MLARSSHHPAYPRYLPIRLEIELITHLFDMLSRPGTPLVLYQWIRIAMAHEEGSFEIGPFVVLTKLFNGLVEKKVARQSKYTAKFCANRQTREERHGAPL